VTGALLRPLLKALAGAAVVAAAAFGLAAAVLPEPSKADHVSLRLLGVLEQGRGHGATIRIGDERLKATCTVVGRGNVIELSSGERLLLKGTQVHRLVGPRNASTRELASVRERELLAVKADLAGSYALYAQELLRRLRHVADPPLVTTVFSGVRAYRIVLSAAPLVELTVTQKTLRPLAARYASAGVVATSVLHPPPVRALASANAAQGC